MSNLAMVPTERRAAVEWAQLASWGDGALRGYAELHAAHPRALKLFGQAVMHLSELGERQALHDAVERFSRNLDAEERMPALLEPGWRLAQRVVEGEGIDELRPALIKLAAERGWALDETLEGSASDRG